MAQTIKLKRSATQGAVPTTSNLALGELAINTYDGKIFIKKNDGSESIVTIGALADNAVTSAKIAANAVTSSEVAANAIGTSEIAANSVGISELNVSDGSDGQVLTTNGSGTLSFTSKSASSQSFYLNTATGDGNTTGFTLSTTPASESYIIAFIDGVFQNQDSYTFSGTTLTFDTAPANGTTVTVYVVGSIYSGNAVVLDTFSGDNSETAFTLSEDPQSENNTQVYIDGVYQQKSEYSVSGQTITFSSAPPTGTNNIEVIAFTSTNLTVLNANSVTSASIASGAVNTSDIADNAITSAKIASGVIVASDVADNSITSAKIALNAVGASELASGALNGQTFTGDSEITGEFTADEFIGDLRGAVLFKAQAGENVAKGDVVYISGISGNTTVVSKADADDASKMPAFGIVAATTTSGQPVDIYTQGILTDLDTSAYSEGDELFVSTTAGALTDTAPTGETAKLQKIAKVTRSNNLSGSIFITGAGRTNAVPNLDEDQFFLGNASNQAVATDFSDAVEALSINNVVEDTTPQLGGNLDLNSNNITGTGNIDITGNITTTGYLAGPSTFTIDPAAVGDNTGTVVIAGNFQVDGTTTTVNSTTITVDDKLLTLASGSINAAAANGGGIEIDITGSTNPSILYDGTNDEWDFNKDINVTGTVTADGLTVDTNTLYVDSTNNRVGIGTTSPSSELHVYNNGTSSQFRVQNNDGTAKFQKYQDDLYITNDDTGDILFNVSDSETEAMRIDSSGNVGIGTSSPSDELDISSVSPAIRLTDTTTAGLYHTIVSASDDLLISADAGNVGANTEIEFAIDGTERMRIDSSGNLLVGTTNSGLSSSSSATGINLIPNGASTFARSGGSVLYANRISTDGNIIQLRKDGTHIGSIGVKYSDDPYFSSQAEDIGISLGTSSLYPSGSTGITNDNAIDIGSSSVRFKALYLSNTINMANNVALNMRNAADTANYRALRVNTSNNLELHDGKVVIEPAGNVGIGTSDPDAYLHVYGTNAEQLRLEGNDEYTYLRFQGTPSGGSSSALGDIGFGNYSGTAVDLNIANRQAGALTFHTNTSFTERMRIDSSGNVGIGTDNPSTPLHVSGNVTIDTDANSRFTIADGGNNAITLYGGSLDELYVGANAAYKLRFKTDGNIVMDNGGSFGIGTSSPAEALHVESRAKIGNITLAGNSTDSTLSAGNANFKISTLQFTGGAGGLDFDVALAITGGIQAVFQIEAAGAGDTYTNDGTISSLSDERVKTDIQDLTDGLEIVKQLRPVTFKYNDTSTSEEGHKLMGGASDKVRYGFIAQEVEQIAPQYIEYSTRKINNEEVDDFRNLSTTRMLPMLFKAVQELSAKLEAAEARITELEG